MEMQFDKIPVPYLKKLTRGLRTQEQTLEVRLPDGMPDIGRVLDAWGQVIVRSKEWNGDNMTLSCGVMAWVLYVPEDEEGVRSVEAWLPFSLKWELPDSPYDGKMLTSCLLRGVDARSTSARKLMVRANLGAMAEAWLPAEAQVAVAGELPEDIQLLTANYPMMLPKEAGEKAFLMEEQLGFSTTGPKPEKLLYYCLQPEIIDKKVMAGKVVFRGSGMLHVLYKGEDGRAYSWDYELPFSQYGDLEGEYSQDAMVSVYPCVTSLDLSLEDNGTLQMKAGILGQYMLCDRTMVTVAEDAYSPHRPLALHFEELELPAVLEQTTQNLRVEQTAQVDAEALVDLLVLPEHGQLERTENGVEYIVPGQFQMLYYDSEGELRSAQTPWQTENALQTAEDAMVDMWISSIGKPQGILGAGSVNLRSDAAMELRTGSGRGISMITGLDMGEMAKPNPDRPSLIVCKKGDERLWDMAKKTGSTVEAIMSANRLENEPEADRILLIPIL